MTPIPPCRAVGGHCLSLRVTLRVATAETDDIRTADHEATWLLGHTERIDFGPLRRKGRELFASARLVVACRFADQSDGSVVRCRAHGFEGQVRPPRRAAQPRQLGGERFAVVDRGRVETRRLPAPAPRPKALPVVDSPNPCATARCRTADHRLGAACCRDLQVEVVCRSADPLDALIRTRQSPYLCKVTRETPDTLGAEMISACGFLEAGGTNCTLHGRTRSDGRSAKPDLCFTWPESDDVHHPGCAFLTPKT